MWHLSISPYSRECLFTQGGMAQYLGDKLNFIFYVYIASRQHYMHFLKKIF